jgi:hypothetical protein
MRSSCCAPVVSLGVAQGRAGAAESIYRTQTWMKPS